MYIARTEAFPGPDAGHGGQPSTQLIMYASREPTPPMGESQHPHTPFSGLHPVLPDPLLPYYFISHAHRGGPVWSSAFSCKELYRKRRLTMKCHINRILS